MIAAIRTSILDRLRHSPILREAIAGAWYAKSQMTFGSTAKKLAALGHSVRLSERKKLWRIWLNAFWETAQGGGDEIWREAVECGSSLPAFIRSKPSELTRSVVLKAPGNDGEKGVLLLYFEYNLARLLELPAVDRTWIAERYDVILIASWCPTDYTLLARALLLLPDGLWIQPAAERERAKMEAFHPKLRCLPGLACDWVEPSFYHPKPWDERSIHLLMVANWGRYKRHWEFFQALQRLPETWRVVLVGHNGEGGKLKDVQQMAERMRPRQKLEFLKSISSERVSELQCDARISLVLSRREGGCVAIVESLFAGCAVAMRADACIGAAAHVNERTGMLLRPGKIAEDLRELMQRGARLDSAAWATEHVACQVTLGKIQTVLKARAIESGIPWTCDLAQPHWRPYPILARAEDRERLRPAYQELHERFPTLFTEDLIENSCRT